MHISFLFTFLIVDFNQVGLIGDPNCAILLVPRTGIRGVAIPVLTIL